MQFTVIKYYGKQNSRCGYCSNSNSNTKSSHCHGMHAYIMEPKDYQDLIDRGWRRSGEYCYKPNNKVTCCPCYTIRSDTTEFKLSKSQKKILKRMNKFLCDGIKDKNNSDIARMDTSCQVATNLNGDSGVSSAVCIQNEPEAPNIPIRNIRLDEIKKGKNESSTIPTDTDQPKTVASSSLLPSVKISSNAGNDINDTRPPCKKAKHMRMERRQAKLLAKGLTEELITSQTNLKHRNKEKSLNDFINDVSEQDKHKLKVILVPSYKGVSGDVFNLYCKYQMSIHDDQPQRLTKAQFERFLVKSPLKRMDIFGSFHQQYWLDDKLIAVGVIDILPNCVSSVYFFYDPDYSFLTLGTYGSLREIDFTQQLSKKISSLKYYYMGFYIHSCPKMRYKGKITPSFLLCPETYNWTLLTDNIRQNLDDAKYQRFNHNPNECDPNDFSESDLDDVLVLVDGSSYVTYRQYIQITGDNGDRNAILEYGKLVGKSCAHRMLYEQS